MASSVVSIDARIRKSYPATKDSPAFVLDLHLQAGDSVTALLGPSGAGKTLTLNCIAGFAKPDEGRILVRDELYFDAATRVNVPPNHRKCGYIFQDHALFANMTVRENLRFAADSARRRAKVQRHRRIQELLEEFELAELDTRRPHELSGGQRQRAAIARALASDPQVLLLDEPTRGMDYRLRQSFYQYLRKAKAALVAPVLMVTHDAEECFELADTVFLIEAGKSQQSGGLTEVFRAPASVDVARSLGLFALLPAEIAALDPGRNTSRVRVLNHELDGPYLPAHFLGDRGWLCVRRNEMRLVSTNDRAAQNVIRLKPVGVAKSPRGMRVQFGGDLSEGFNVDLSEAEYEDLRGGRDFAVYVPPTAISFLSA
jgi:molybdate transport system ATP-binding protein